jgi:protein-L-isoaspartate(D-aspartate) O-methyltransferase
MKALSIPPLCLGMMLLFSKNGWAQEDFQQRREAMVEEQVIKRGLYHSATIKAMKKVPRHLFVPEYQQKKAYEDRPLPIGHGQTISQPYMVAYMTAVLKPEPGMRILEIGTGSGYQAAVLAEIVDTVYTIEIVEKLGKKAAKTFQELGYDNIVTKIGDGYQGWAEHAPFDGIIVTAAPQTIPPPLIEQLAEGGRMIIPVGPAHLAQELKLVKKKENGKIKESSLFPVRFVPFKRNE